MLRDCGRNKSDFCSRRRSRRNETQFIGLNPDTAIKSPVSTDSSIQEEQMPKLEDGHIVETTLEARGAERGPTVRNMLVWGIGLVVVAFVVVYALYFKA
jgi:hypothetical protein